MLSKEYGGHGRALKEYSLEKPVSTVVLKMCERKEKSEQFGFGIFSKELFFFFKDIFDQEHRNKERRDKEQKTLLSIECLASKKKKKLLRKALALHTDNG